MSPPSTGTLVLLASLALISSACTATAPAPTPNRSSSVRASTSIPTLHDPAGAFDSDVVAGLRTAIDMPYTEPLPCGRAECAVPLDVLAPEGGATDLPTIVLVPGGPRPFHFRRYTDLLAAALARHGAVVFLISYRNSSMGNPLADSLHDIGCGIRYARSVTPEYGGDPTRVVLVGHSLGSGLSLQLAVRPEAPTPGCLASGDALPEATVGMAGFNVDLAGAAAPGPPLFLVGAEMDPQSGGGAAAAQRLRDAGFEAAYREFADTTHDGLVEPEVTPGVVDLIFEAIGLIR